MKPRSWKLMLSVALAAVALCAVALVANTTNASQGVEQLKLQPGELPAWAHADAEPMWFDLLNTRGGSLDLLRRPIPGAVFGPSAPDFSGAIELVGKDLRAGGPFDFGDGDLALMRFGPDPVPGIGEAAQVTSVVAALSWHSAQPVLIDDGATTALWHVQVTLSPRGGFPRGNLELHRETRFGGTANFSVEAPLLLRFYTDAGREVTFDTHEPQTSFGQVLLQAQNVPWTLGCAGNSLRLAKLSDDLCLGVSENDSRAPWQLAGSGLDLTMEAATHSAEELRVRFKSAQVAPSARVAASAKLQGQVRVLEGAVVGSRAEIGVRSLIGEGALVSADAKIGRGVSIGRDSYIGPEARIGRRTTVGALTVIHRGARIAPDVKIGEGVLIRSNTVIETGAVIEAGTSIGIGAKIGAGALVLAGSRLAGRTAIQPGVIAPNKTYQCMFPDYTWVAATLADCAAMKGAVRGYIKPVPLKAAGYPVGGNTFFLKQIQQTPVGNPTPDQQTQLGDDVDASGVGDNEYSDDYDCDDFADDLEQHLEGEGWNATFTVIFVANGEHEWYNWLWTDEWESGHAMTDVHLPDGSTVWIEAQWNSGEGAVGQDLDADNDGNVGTAGGPGDGLTEGNTRVEVYDSAQAAEDAGRALD